MIRLRNEAARIIGSISLVSEREGMRMVAMRDGNFVSGPMRVEIWEMTRSDWLAGRQ